MFPPPSVVERTRMVAVAPEPVPPVNETFVYVPTWVPPVPIFVVNTSIPVSYTHLTLPTICSV